MSQQTLIASQHPKVQEILRNIGVGIDKVGLDEEALQRVVHRARELQKGVIELVTSLSLTNQYADQEVASTWAYPTEYAGTKAFHDQLVILTGSLPSLNSESAWAWFNEDYSKLETPDWVEGAFAVPSEFALQRLFHPEITDRAAAYCASVSLLMGKIADSRKFYNYRDGQIDQNHLWRSERTVEMLDALWEMQGKPDIIILPAQLGMRHRGRSVLRARECYAGNEFGAGSLEGLAIALTHPDRFVRWEQLHEDMAGDDFSSGADGQAAEAPYLHFFGDDRVKFATYSAGCAREYFGSVSCWLPPQ